MIIGLSDLPTNGTSELIMDYDPFHLMHNNESEVAIYEMEDLLPVEISGEEDESEPRLVKLKYQQVAMAKAQILEGGSHKIHYSTVLPH